jgi:hypothetical protein
MTRRYHRQIDLPYQVFQRKAERVFFRRVNPGLNHLRSDYNVI